MTKHAHDRGLQYDLWQLGQRGLPRRKLLRWGLGAGLLGFVGCEVKTDLGSAGPAAGSGGSGPAAGSGGGASTNCSKISEETAGPYPGDGSNGVNALASSGIVRSDIRSSFGSSSTLAEGVPLEVTLEIVNTSDGCSPLAGCAVYIWHCDSGGNYSLYSQSVLNENYLRGVQESDDAGSVTFETIFPACYSGRWPHIHFEVYPGLSAIASAANKLATSQLALPEDACKLVFAQSGYETSVRNLAGVSLSSDMVFSDGVTLQTPAMEGNVTSGYAARLKVPVRA
jgi:protocatechuate 3,4-dioxygenase beta subunit